MLFDRPPPGIKKGSKIHEKRGFASVLGRSVDEVEREAPGACGDRAAGWVEDLED